MSRSKSAMPIEQLIERCIRGDRKCQLMLFDTYKAKVHGIAWKMLGPRFDVDDAVQEIFINLFQSLPTFKWLCSVDTWVYRLSLKTCTDHLRRKYRKRKVDITADGGEAELFAADESPEATTTSVERKELRQQLIMALDKLTTEKRQVVVLFEMEGKTIEEIAEIIQAPPGTIKSRLFHGRNELKSHLKRYMDL